MRKDYYEIQRELANKKTILLLSISAVIGFILGFITCYLNLLD